MTSFAIGYGRARASGTLWRYVIRELVSPTLLAFGVLTFLLLMRILLRISELWIQFGADLPDLLWSIIYNLPHIIVLTLPMAVLVGALITLGRMSADFEIIALRAVGVSIWQLVPPVMTFGVLLWALNAYVYVVAMPWGNASMRELQWDAVANRAFADEVRPRVFNETFPNHVLFIEDIVDRGGEPEWKGVFVAQVDVDPPQIMRAARGRTLLDVERRTTYLRLEDAVLINSQDDPRQVTLTHFESRQFQLWAEQENSLLDDIGKTERSMTGPELHQEIARRDAMGEPTAYLWVEIHKKYALPFACVVMALIAVPLGVSAGRQTTATGYVMATGVIILYYYCFQYGEQRAEAGVIGPAIGMWSGNLIVGTLGAVLLWNKATERRWGIIARLRPLMERAEDAARSGFERLVLRTRSATDATSVNPRLTRARALSPRQRFPRTLDRYVLQSYATLFALTFCGLLAVFVVFEALDKVSYVEHPELVPTYLRARLPSIVFDVIPIAGVVTVLTVFSLMSMRNEVVAAMTGGISLYRLALPILVPAIALSGAQYMLQDYVLPYTNPRAEALESEMRGSQVRTVARQPNWVFSAGSRIYHFDSYDSVEQTFSRLRVYYLGNSENAIPRMEFAGRAHWDATRERWIGENGWRRYFVTGGPNGSMSTALEEFQLLELPIEEQPSYFAADQRSSDQMTAMQLRSHVQQLADRGLDTRRALVDFHMKISYPAVAFVMTLVALPFAFLMGRKGALTGIGVGVGLVVVYYIAFGVFRAVGYAGQLPPPLAAWAPHLMFACFAGYAASSLRT